MEKLMNKVLGRTMVICVALVGATCVTASTASAEKIIRAVYHINLTDAASGKTFNTTRLSVRSWPKMDQCEVQKSGGAALNLRVVEGYGIKNSAGTPLTVTLKSSECID